MHPALKEIIENGGEIHDLSNQGTNLAEFRSRRLRSQIVSDVDEGNELENTESVEE